MKTFVNKVLEDLTNLDFQKKAWVVHFEYKYVTTDKKCRYCKGTGTFKHGNNLYHCVDCSGTGKVGERKGVHTVSGVNPIELYFTVKQNTVEMPMYYDIRGIFNTKKKAFDLAEELNKDK